MMSLKLLERIKHIFRRLSGHYLAIGSTVVGFGMVIVSFYCINIRYWPGGIDAGDIFSFVLVSVSFSFFYGLMLGMCVFLSVWFVALMLCAQRRVESTRAKHCAYDCEHCSVQAAAEVENTISFQFLPLLRGKVLPTLSFFGAVLFACTIAVLPQSNPNFYYAFGYCFISGTLLLFIFGVDRYKGGVRVDALESTGTPEVANGWVIAVMLILAYPFIHNGGYFLQMAMKQIGIRVEGSHIVLMSKENYAKVQMAAFSSAVPLFACKHPKIELWEVHRVDVEWQRLGEMARIRVFSVGDKGREVKLSLDGKGITSLEGGDVGQLDGEKATALGLLVEPFAEPKTCDSFSSPSPSTPSAKAS